MKKSTKNISLAAVMSALCVMILLMGSLITVLDLSTAAAASLIIIFCTIELGGIYPWLVWAVVSSISLLLLPDKFGALVFFLFAGHYPILKKYIERLPRVFQWVVKLLLFNIILTGIIWASKVLLGLPDTEISFSYIVYGICNVTFVVYDIALTRLITFYIFKLRHRFKFIQK